MLTMFRPPAQRKITIMESKQFKEKELVNPLHKQALNILINLAEVFFSPFRTKLQEFVDEKKKELIIGMPIVALVENIRDKSEGLIEPLCFGLNRLRANYTTQTGFIFPVLDCSFKMDIEIPTLLGPRILYFFGPAFIILQEELGKFIPELFLEDEVSLGLLLIEIWAQRLRYMSLRFRQILSEPYKLCSADVTLYMAQQLSADKEKILQNYISLWMERIAKARAGEIHYLEYQQLKEEEKVDLACVGLLSALSWVNFFAAELEAEREPNSSSYFELVTKRVIWA